jgi:hypothetical protein
MIKHLLPALALALTAGSASAEWLQGQPETDPVHQAVALVVLDGCTVSHDRWTSVYTDLGGDPADAEFHVQMMFKHGELISEADGRLKLNGVVGC